MLRWHVIAFVIALVCVIAIPLTITLLPPPKSPPPSSYFPQNESNGWVSYPRLGANGRLGNQLFQISSVVGLGQFHHKVPKIPDWDYKEFFEPTPFVQYDKHVGVTNSIPLVENKCYDFEPNIKPTTKNLVVDGYRQNPRYFNHCTHEIRRLFRFAPHLVQNVLEQCPLVQSPCIGVQVRRGDYVENPIHEVCSVEYYKHGIAYFHTLYGTNLPILFVSDDIEYCKSTFHYPNVEFSNFKTDMEDMICLSMCKYKVISNSSFGWWAAWLDNRYDSQVFLPRPWINEPLYSEGCNDLYDEMSVSFDVRTHALTEPQHVALDIGCYYQCYKQPFAFVNVLRAYRGIYPDSTLIIVSDAGDDFSKAARYFRADSYTTNSKTGGNAVTTNLTDLDQLKLFVRNFINGARQMKEEYFILMEDDVLLTHSIRLQKSQLGDITGMNQRCELHILLQDIIRRYVKINRFQVGGCGGSLFRTSFWASLDMDTVSKQLDAFDEAKRGYHTDLALSFLCYVNNGVMVHGLQLEPREMTEEMPGYGIPRLPAIVHQMKHWYNTKVTSNEQDILSYDTRKDEKLIE